MRSASSCDSSSNLDTANSSSRITFSDDLRLSSASSSLLPPSAGSRNMMGFPHRNNSSKDILVSPLDACVKWIVRERPPSKTTDNVDASSISTSSVTCRRSCARNCRVCHMCAMRTCNVANSSAATKGVGAVKGAMPSNARPSPLPATTAALPMVCSAASNWPLSEVADHNVRGPVGVGVSSSALPPSFAAVSFVASAVWASEALVKSLAGEPQSRAWRHASGRTTESAVPHGGILAMAVLLLPAAPTTRADATAARIASVREASNVSVHVERPSH
eukprot:CAMPEP_0117578266 /NCGR_PEP_ID=MMETSP0784-20121206/63900_1 /TAXON_ID=39447 /ORGANISM="" /LENGTH=275 /DNA_ID=CAMNT_0005377895 /DNA_START=406 /DNA_END=1230 /DNA_ORIENTATION=+